MPNIDMYVHTYKSKYLCVLFEILKNEVSITERIWFIDLSLKASEKHSYFIYPWELIKNLVSSIPFQVSTISFNLLIFKSG